VSQEPITKKNHFYFPDRHVACAVVVFARVLVASLLGGGGAGKCLVPKKIFGGSHVGIDFVL
jgi:hypothetical protein